MDASVYSTLNGNLKSFSSILFERLTENIHKYLDFLYQDSVQYAKTIKRDKDMTVIQGLFQTYCNEVQNWNIKETTSHNEAILKIQGLDDAQYRLNQVLLHKLYLLSGSIATSKNQFVKPWMSLPSFIHACHIVCAEQIGFKYPYLFDSVHVTGEKRQKYHHNASKKILNHIWLTVDYVLMGYVKELREPGGGSKSFASSERKISPDGIRSTINPRDLYPDTASVRNTRPPEPTPVSGVNQNVIPSTPKNPVIDTKPAPTPFLAKITRANEKTLQNDRASSFTEKTPSLVEKTTDKKQHITPSLSKKQTNPPNLENNAEPKSSKKIETKTMDLVLENTVSKTSKKKQPTETPVKPPVQPDVQDDEKDEDNINEDDVQTENQDTHPDEEINQDEEEKIVEDFGDDEWNLEGQPLSDNLDDEKEEEKPKPPSKHKKHSHNKNHEVDDEEEDEFPKSHSLHKQHDATKKSARRKKW